MIPTEDEPLTTTRKHYPNSIKKIPKKILTLAPSSTPKVGDSAIENIEVKLTHLKKKKNVKKCKKKEIKKNIKKKLREIKIKKIKEKLNKLKKNKDK